jgi:pimeloyl-ACP methyl ester carboxylesterase
MLELIALDSHPSVYVGRPCYLGLADSAGCDPRQWTSHRYSAEVLGSLQRVIEQLVAEGAYDQVMLFGHSGGGTLATLLATRLPRTTALVTIAPNLDVRAWTDTHGYTPLTGSLDPALTKDFPRGIFQVHWFGDEDEEIPPSLIEGLEPYFDEGQLRVIEGFNHSCCWSEIWPNLLDELDAYFVAAKGALGSTLATTDRLEKDLQ